MTKKKDYIDNVVLKLKRNYSKDELVAHLTKELSEAQQEIGILKGEKDELNFKFQKLLKLDQTIKSRIGQFLWYQQLKKQKKELEEKLRKLKLDNSKMLEQIAKFNSQEQISKQLIQEIHLEWGENWDLVIEFFGQEIADKFDKIMEYKQ